MFSWLGMHPLHRIYKWYLESKLQHFDSDIQVSRYLMGSFGGVTTEIKCSIITVSIEPDSHSLVYSQWPFWKRPSSGLNVIPL